MATTMQHQPVTTPAPSLFTTLHIVCAMLANAPATAWRVKHVFTFPSILTDDGVFLAVAAESVANPTTNVTVTARTWEPLFDVQYTYSYDTETDEREVYDMMNVAPIPVTRTVTESAMSITKSQTEWLIR